MLSKARKDMTSAANGTDVERHTGGITVARSLTEAGPRRPKRLARQELEFGQIRRLVMRVLQIPTPQRIEHDAICDIELINHRGGLDLTKRLQCPRTQLIVGQGTDELSDEARTGQNRRGERSTVVVLQGTY